MTQVYRLPRPTADIDILEVEPSDYAALLGEVAGFGSSLAKKHRVHLHQTAIQTVPADFHDRVAEMFAGCYSRLHLWALDPYDLALSKLERNIQRDRDDVKHLAAAVPLDLEVLRNRYESEMRPYLAKPEREDLTLKLWIGMVKES